MRSMDLARSLLVGFIIINAFAPRAEGLQLSPADDEVLAGTVPAFVIDKSDIRLSRPARPGTYFDKVGRRFALLGDESGSFEAWAYPLKLLRGFELSFLIGSSTTPIRGRDVVRFIDVEPETTTLTFTYQSFTVRAHYVVAVDEPGAVILLEVESTEPLTVVCGFLPSLTPMWPAGLGGQYAHWDENLKAYLISEPTRRNHAYIGSPAARGISYTPAHMLSDAPNEFKVEIARPQAVRGRFIPVVLAGGKGKREEVRAVYEKLGAAPAEFYSRARGHYRSLRASSLKVRTPDRRLNLAFEWAKAALDNLMVDNPDLGTGMVAGLGPSGTGGRPGFGWFFGGDSYLNSLSLNSLGLTDSARQALAFTRKWQRQDGKMAHELSQAAGYINWWRDYPYGYIHGDTTPYYIVAVGDYFKKTGDTAFLKECWPSVVKAYEWCLTTDKDGDSLMDNAAAGLGALEFGALTGIQTDVYLASVWVEAGRTMAYLADNAGDRRLRDRAALQAERSARAWNEKFWEPGGGLYCYAFSEDGRQVSELTPWSAVGLAWGLGDRQRGMSTLRAMNSPDLTTDWGVRMLSALSPYFEPLNYNYGACWPFLTGWVSLALFEYGYIPQAAALLMANAAHSFDNALGAATELYSGHQNVWPQEGVPHQGFSTTGLVLPLVRGLLGLDGDTAKKRLTISPKLPAGWESVSVSDWRTGRAVTAFNYEKRGARAVLEVTSENAGGFKLLFEPWFGPGTEVRSVTVNGQKRTFESSEEPSGGAVKLSVEFVPGGRDTIEVELVPAPEVDLTAQSSRTGDTSRGVRLISTGMVGDRLELIFSGPAGETCFLPVADADRVAAAEGAEIEGGRVKLVFSAGRTPGYQERKVVFKLKPYQPRPLSGRSALRGLRNNAFPPDSRQRPMKG